PERPAYLPVDAVDTWSAATATATDPDGIASPEPAPTLQPALSIEQLPAFELTSDPQLDSPDPALEPTPEPTESVPPTAPLRTAASAPQSPLRVTAIGDSVMLGAVQALQVAIDGIVIDAAISRQTSTAIDILRSRSGSGELGDVVVVHMGNN